MQNLKNSFASFWKYRYLLQNLITRDFKLKYRRSVLGVAWSVLNPLLTCLVMWAVFGALFNQRGDGIEDFPLFLIIGQLMFNFFRESTSMAMWNRGPRRCRRGQACRNSLHCRNVPWENCVGHISFPGHARQSYRTLHCHSSSDGPEITEDQ